ncbi:MAG: hypothetical protein ABF913_04850 [Oenococcus sp.]|uniref:hypothetical protein n=1 Tax=Oenococcus sp. TaxID=1979414 RepID=UPI0039EB31F1
MTPKEYVEAKQDKYYHVKNEAEYNWLMKKLEKDGYKWFSGYEPKSLPYCQSFEVICIEEDHNFLITHVHFDWFKENRSGKTLIEVSTLMKQDDKIYMTDEEKAEFDYLREKATLFSALDTIHSAAASFPKLWRRIFYFSSEQQSIKQLEFSRAFANPDLIVVKKPDRWAYMLKKEFRELFMMNNYLYLGLGNSRSLDPEYHTQSEWQQVDNKIKVAFKRVYEVEK